MRIKDLLSQWEATNKSPRAVREFRIHLPLEEAAQILALKEMYPDRTEQQLLGDLLSAVLSEMEQHFPYVAGKKIGEDEFGDPIFEDAGLTPRFLQLTRKYVKVLEAENATQPETLS